MSDPSPTAICATCDAVIPPGSAAFIPAEDLEAAPLVLCRACGDLDLEVDP